MHISQMMIYTKFDKNQMKNVEGVVFWGNMSRNHYTFILNFDPKMRNPKIV